MKTGREFLFAIKESTHTEFDEDAGDFLDAVCEAITGMCKEPPGGNRDATFFFEGMLRGVQLRLKRDAGRARAKLFEAGALGPDGEPDLPEH